MTSPAITITITTDSVTGASSQRFMVKGCAHPQCVGRYTETRETVAGREVKGDVYTFAASNVLSASGGGRGDLPTIKQGALIAVDGETFAVKIMSWNRDQVTLTAV